MLFLGCCSLHIQSASFLTLTPIQEWYFLCRTHWFPNSSWLCSCTHSTTWESKRDPHSGYHSPVPERSWEPWFWLDWPLVIIFWVAPAPVTFLRLHHSFIRFLHCHRNRSSAESYSMPSLFEVQRICTNSQYSVPVYLGALFAVRKNILNSCFLPVLEGANLPSDGWVPLWWWPGSCWICHRPPFWGCPGPISWPPSAGSSRCASPQWPWSSVGGCSAEQPW